MATVQNIARKDAEIVAERIKLSFLNALHPAFQRSLQAYGPMAAKELNVNSLPCTCNTENGTKSNHGTFTFSRSKIESDVIQFFLGVSDKLKAMKKVQNVTG